MFRDYEIIDAARRFEAYLLKADSRRMELEPDQRSKDSLLSVFYEKADKCLCNLKQMGLVEW
jgi:hypothetical protein